MTLHPPSPAHEWRTDRAELVYGERPSGEIVHISSVERGLKCGCRCPGCHRPLVAKTRAEKQVAHFAHAGPACGGGPETALHKLAKQIIAVELRLKLPERLAVFSEKQRLLSDSKEVTFDRARVEYNDLREIVPDLYLDHHGRALFVEVAVTHKCGEDKIEKIRNQGIAAIEIDLSRIPRDASLEDLKDAVLRTAPRSWIFNKGIDEGIASMRAEALRDKEEQERKLEEQAKRLAVVFQSAKNQRVEGFTQKREWQLLERVDGTDLVGVELAGNSVFAVAARQWQITVLIDVLLHRKLGRDLQTPVSVCKYLQRLNLVRKDFLYLRESLEERVSRYEAEFRAPWRVVGAYLDFLTEQGIAAQLRKGYTIAPAVGSRWLEASMEIGAARLRIDSAAEQVQRILGVADPARRSAMTVGRWFSSMDPQSNLTFGEALQSSEHHVRIERELRAIEAMLDGRSAIPSDALALPIDDLIAAAEEQQAMRERARREREEHRRAEACYQRIADLRGMAEPLFAAEELEVWLTTQHIELSGVSPAAAAETGGFSFTRAKDILVSIKQQKERVDAERARIAGYRKLLETEAYAVLGQSEATEFLRVRDEELGGMPPGVFCKDANSLERCRVRLRQWDAFLREIKRR